MATAPYAPFRRVIRGYDPLHRGAQIHDHAVTVDGGCGFGGKLICAGFDETGEITAVIESDG
jgi:serine/threonine protein phosphatase 1